MLSNSNLNLLYEFYDHYLNLTEAHSLKKNIKIIRYFKYFINKCNFQTIFYYFNLQSD